MTDLIKTLYQTAGVDTDSLEHKLRLRWNGLTVPKRRAALCKIVDQGDLLTIANQRWDWLPEYIQKALTNLAEQKRKENTA